MRKFGRQLLAAGILASILAAIGTWVWRDQIARRERAEPGVGSVPLSRWLLTNLTQGYHIETDATLARIGGDAVPALAWVAERGISPLEIRFLPLRSHLPTTLRPMMYRLIVADPSRSVEAMRMLGSLGPEASNAVPALLRLVKVDFMQTRYAALTALLKIAPQNQGVRAAALAYLDSFPNAASQSFAEAHYRDPEALPGLLRAVNGNGNLRNVLPALRRYGAAASNALPALRIFLKGEKYYAVPVLREMGPSAAPVTEELAARLGEIETRDLEILDTLRRIGPGAAAALPRVRHYLTATNSVTRLLAEATAASLRGEPTAVLPSFQDALKTPPPFGTWYEMTFPLLEGDLYYSLSPRQMVCWLAGEMGPAAAPILPSLEACLTDKNDLLKALAAWGHWRIARRPDQALPALRAVLRGEDPNAQMLAICALIEIGPPAVDAEPELQALRKLDLTRRRLVNLALTEIHPK